ncbi:hypothetical protein ACJX0J_023814, partial [Zea mays]
LDFEEGATDIFGLKKGSPWQPSSCAYVIFFLVLGVDRREGPEIRRNFFEACLVLTALIPSVVVASLYNDYSIFQHLLVASFSISELSYLSYLSRKLSYTVNAHNCHISIDKAISAAVLVITISVVHSSACITCRKHSKEENRAPQPRNGEEHPIDGSTRMNFIYNGYQISQHTGSFYMELTWTIKSYYNTLLRTILYNDGYWRVST